MDGGGVYKKLRLCCYYFQVFVFLVWKGGLVCLYTSQACIVLPTGLGLGEWLSLNKRYPTGLDLQDGQLLIFS